MMIIEGKYNKAIIYGDIVDDNAKEQIKEFCNQKSSIGRKIRIMPDVHAGKGCVIGFTADIGDIVIPSIVGVDIGCGMLTVSLGNIEIDFEKLDDIIHKYVPSGTSVHEGRLVRFPKLQNLKCYRNLRDTKRLERSIGTLGGGNHFIEADKNDEGNIYIVVHSGSRRLGLEVAKYYQEEGYKVLNHSDEASIQQMIAEMKKAGRQKDIQKEIKRLKNVKQISIPRDMAYVTGELFDRYIHDMKIVQEYAALNRQAMIDEIVKGMKFHVEELFTTIHNYIDTDNMILRKGPVSAQKGERLLIPINMRDGSLICEGKGNEDWNFSAPHGAGRLMSRADAKQSFTVSEYKKQMEGIYTTSANKTTLDECPMAYKGMKDILDNIGPTADVLKIIRPIYNFKAGAED